MAFALKENSDFEQPFDFEQKLCDISVPYLQATGIDILQVNLGKMCNQVCKHCHVDAGPHRTEIMTKETMDVILRVLGDYDIPMVDMTGGAPEMNPNFKYFAEGISALGRKMIDRCNLTILSEPGNEDLADFLFDHNVEIVASLPYYLGENVDAQRGRGVFEKSISALEKLNSLGYGIEGSGYVLNLVYNPTGAYLPPEQEAMEQDYKNELKSRFGIQFNNLFTITNMPISRFLKFLDRTKNYEKYMTKLVQAFNPTAIDSLMCRSMVSVGWDGKLYDCDFNQMLEMSLMEGQPQSIENFDYEKLASRIIKTDSHCFGCTAGSGSSCGGAIA